MTTSATATWSALPDGEAITIEPGYSYAVVALVKNSHDAASIKSLIAQKGLTIVDYQDPVAVDASYPPADDGYRYLSAIVSTTSTTPTSTLPWKVPSPLSLFDSTTLVHAWAELTPAGQALGLSTSPPVPPSPFPWGPVLAGGVVVGGAGLLWWLHRRHEAR